MSAAEKIKNFFKKKKTEAKFKVSDWLAFPRTASFSIELIRNDFQLAGPGRRLDSSEAAPSTSKSTKAQSDVFVPPKRKELTSEAR